MEENWLLLLPILFPILIGIWILAGKKMRENRKKRLAVVTLGLAGTLALTLAAVFTSGSLKLLALTDRIVIAFHVDGVGVLFALLTTAMWLLVGIYSFTYLTHEHQEARFWGFYLIVLGVLVGLDFSANLVSFYVFYELMTLTSLPLVLHEGTKEAVMAGLKYLFYSIAGAFLALFGLFFLASVAGSGAASGIGSTEAVNACGILSFLPGGSFSPSAFAGKEGLALASVFCMLVGFGTKAGMFPLHGWLPTAHPVAPAPASAVLSGIITKSGVLAVIRVVYFLVGPGFLKGTWVQSAWILLTLLTVFMGSMLAYREPVLKKRLAYSTVSQVSYILFGLSLLEPTAFVGALSHVVFHSLVKNALFLAAGAVIFQTGWTRVSQMRGLGRVMPILLFSYTLVSLTLIGIPPTSGFVSKWYLATGALASGTGAWSVIGPVVLLVSALLTAGYLLPLTINGFFPGADFDDSELRERKLLGKEPSWFMLVPVLLMTAGAVLFGCFPEPFLNALKMIAASVLSGR